MTILILVSGKHFNDIVEDLKAEPDHNGAKGNIRKDEQADTDGF